MAKLCKEGCCFTLCMEAYGTVVECRVSVVLGDTKIILDSTFSHMNHFRWNTADILTGYISRTNLVDELEDSAVITLHKEREVYRPNDDQNDDSSEARAYRFVAGVVETMCGDTTILRRVIAVENDEVWERFKAAAHHAAKPGTSPIPILAAKTVAELQKACPSLHFELGLHPVSAQSKPAICNFGFAAYYGAFSRISLLVHLHAPPPPVCLLCWIVTPVESSSTTTAEKCPSPPHDTTPARQPHSTGSSGRVKSGLHMRGSFTRGFGSRSAENRPLPQLDEPQSAGSSGRVKSGLHMRGSFTRGFGSRSAENRPLPQLDEPQSAGSSGRVKSGLHMRGSFTRGFGSRSAENRPLPQLDEPQSAGSSGRVKSGLHMRGSFTRGFGSRSAENRPLPQLDEPQSTGSSGRVKSGLHMRGSFTRGFGSRSAENRPLPQLDEPQSAGSSGRVKSGLHMRGSFTRGFGSRSAENRPLPQLDEPQSAGSSGRVKSGLHMRGSFTRGFGSRSAENRPLPQLDEPQSTGSSGRVKSGLHMRGSFTRGFGSRSAENRPLPQLDEPQSAGSSGRVKSGLHMRGSFTRGFGSRSAENRPLPQLDEPQSAGSSGRVKSGLHMRGSFTRGFGSRSAENRPLPQLDEPQSTGSSGRVKSGLHMRGSFTRGFGSRSAENRPLPQLDEPQSAGSSGRVKSGLHMRGSFTRGFGSRSAENRPLPQLDEPQSAGSSGRVKSGLHMRGSFTRGFGSRSAENRPLPQLDEPQSTGSSGRVKSGLHMRGSFTRGFGSRSAENRPLPQLDEPQSTGSSPKLKSVLHTWGSFTNPRSPLLVADDQPATELRWRDATLDVRPERCLPAFVLYFDTPQSLTRIQEECAKTADEILSRAFPQAAPAWLKYLPWLQDYMEEEEPEYMDRQEAERLYWTVRRGYEFFEVGRPVEETMRGILIVALYCSSFHRPLNRTLRSDPSRFVSSWVVQCREDLKHALSMLPKSTATGFRGLTHDDPSYRAGMSFVTRAFTSFSTSMRIAQWFASRVVKNRVVWAVCNCTTNSVAFCSPFPDEKEVVLSTGRRLTVIFRLSDAGMVALQTSFRFFVLTEIAAHSYTVEQVCENWARTMEILTTHLRFASAKLRFHTVEESGSLSDDETLSFLIQTGLARDANREQRHVIVLGRQSDEVSIEMIRLYLWYAERKEAFFPIFLDLTQDDSDFSDLDRRVELMLNVERDVLCRLLKVRRVCVFVDGAECATAHRWMTSSVVAQRAFLTVIALQCDGGHQESSSFSHSSALGVPGCVVVRLAVGASARVPRDLVQYVDEISEREASMLAGALDFSDGIANISVAALHRKLPFGDALVAAVEREAIAPLSNVVDVGAAATDVPLTDWKRRTLLGMVNTLSTAVCQDPHCLWLGLAAGAGKKTSRGEMRKYEVTDRGLAEVARRCTPSLQGSVQYLFGAAMAEQHAWRVVRRSGATRRRNWLPLLHCGDGPCSACARVTLQQTPRKGCMGDEGWYFRHPSYQTFFMVRRILRLLRTTCIQLPAPLDSAQTTEDSMAFTILRILSERTNMRGQVANTTTAEKLFDALEEWAAGNTLAHREAEVSRTMSLTEDALRRGGSYRSIYAKKRICRVAYGNASWQAREAAVLSVEQCMWYTVSCGFRIFPQSDDSLRAASLLITRLVACDMLEMAHGIATNVSLTQEERKWPPAGSYVAAVYAAASCLYVLGRRQEARTTLQKTHSLAQRLYGPRSCQVELIQKGISSLLT